MLLKRLTSADETRGTKNGFGMHLLAISPEMFRHFGMVRHWGPEGIRKTTTDSATVWMAGLLCGYNILHNFTDAHPYILTTSLSTNFHCPAEMVPNRPSRDRVFGSHVQSLHGLRGNLSVLAN